MCTCHGVASCRTRAPFQSCCHVVLITSHRVGRLSCGFLWVSCVLVRFAALPEFHRDFTGISPECHQNFAGVLNWSTLKERITTTQPPHTAQHRTSRRNCSLHPAAVRCDMVLHQAFCARRVRKKLHRR